MARIVIAVYGSLGDLHPAIALARGLQSRGHDAAIATSEAYREKIRALGLRFHPVRPDLSLTDTAMVQRVMDGHRASEYLMRKLVFPSVREMHADLRREAADADLLIGGELAFGTRVVAEQCGIPWAYFALSPISFLPVFDPSIIPGPPILHFVQSLGPAANRFVHVLARMISHPWWRELRRLRRELGLPPMPSPLFAGKFSPELNLALFSKRLQPPQPDWPARTVQAGFVYHDEELSAATLPPAVERFLSAGPPPILFTLGSAAVHLARDFYDHAARAAEQLGQRALLLLGKNPPPARLPITSLAVAYLPYARILPRTTAVVHQGGIGTTAQTLRAGVPMLVVPFAHDQFDNAARVVRLGVGRSLPREKFNAVTATQALHELLGSSSLRETARAVGEEIRTEDGLAIACDAIEALLTRRAFVRR